MFFLLLPLEAQAAAAGELAPSARQGSSLTVSRKWPRWLVARWDSRPSLFVVSRLLEPMVKIPALLTRTCKGRSPHESKKERTESRSATSSCLTSSEGVKAAEARVVEEAEVEVLLLLLSFLLLAAAAAAWASSISSRLRAAPFEMERQARTTVSE